MEENIPRDIESSNINSKWLENIYDNIKRIEVHERLAREGCIELIEFMQIPKSEREIFIAEAQYKNLRLMLNELLLVVPDVAPVLDENKVKEFYSKLKSIEEVINIKNNFVNYGYSEVTKTLTNANLTKVFYTVLNLLAMYRYELIILLKNVLYINENEYIPGRR